MFSSHRQEATAPRPSFVLPRQPADSPRRFRSHSGHFTTTGSKLIKRVHRESRYEPADGDSVAASAGEAQAREAVPSCASSESRLERMLQTITPEAYDAGWYDLHVPPGGLEVQPYARDASSFSSYSRSAQDWDGLRTSLLFSDSLQGCVALSNCKSLNGDKPVAPRRVLDIACGATPCWILEVAQQDGWEKTRFVGLDIAPSAVSTVLPTELESRLTFIQHDCRDALPFQTAEFDFVRIGFLNLSLREQDWAALCEEAIRVLTPGGILEVVDEDHMVLGDKGTAFLPGKRLVAVDDLFSDILHHGFINPRALTVLPSSLVMSGGSHLRSTGRISLDLPSSPNSTSSCDKELLEKFAPSRTSSSAAMQTTETRVLLHAYADRWASSSFGLARAAVSVRHRAKPDVGSCRGKLAPDLEQQEFDGVEDLVHAWTDDLRGRADIASLLRSRLGWEPAFDYALQEALETNLAKLDAQMQEDLQRKTLHNEVFGTANREAESAMLQREYSRRETAAELEQVTQRLQGRPAALEERVGSLDFEVFVVQKP